MNNLLGKCKTAFIIGGYGVGNLGDEAILSGILKRFRAINSDLTFYVTANCPKVLEKIHSNVKGIKMPSLGGVIVMLRSDIIVIGGGTIFRKNMRLITQQVPLLAILFSPFKKVIYYSLGIDKDIPSYVRFFLRHSMNHCNFVSVRDEDSRQIIKSLGVKTEIPLVKDPAYELELTTASKFEGLNFINKKIVGLSLRFVDEKNYEGNKDFINIVVDELDKIIGLGYDIVFIPFSNHFFNRLENDCFLGEEIQQKLKNKKSFHILRGDYSPEEILNLYPAFDAFIGMRLHSMIFANISKTPLIPLAYAQKCRSLLKETNTKDYINPKNSNELKNLANLFKKTVQ
jgi:polysaccharide pyruvyl transferase WcaK-like protein